MDNESAIHDTAGGSTGGSRDFLLPWQCGEVECQGRERRDGQTQESWKSVPNVEEEIKVFRSRNLGKET